MSLQEKLAALEEMMSLEDGVLKPETSLDDVDEWDSLSAVSFIVLMKEKFGRNVTGPQIRAFKTVQEMLDVMESE